MGLTRVLHDASAYRAADAGEDGNPRLSSAVIGHRLDTWSTSVTACSAVMERIAASKPFSLQVESGPATSRSTGSILLSLRENVGRGVVEGP